MTEQDKQALIKHFCKRDCGDAAENCEIMPCHEIELIQEFPTTEADSDTISRQAAISAICNACGKIDCDKMDKCEKLQLSPANTSETPNSSDTISRAKAIDALNRECRCGAVIDHCGLETAMDIISELPPAQPEIINCDRCVATKRGECIWHNAGAAYCSLGEVTE